MTRSLPRSLAVIVAAAALAAGHVLLAPFHVRAVATGTITSVSVVKSGIDIWPDPLPEGMPDHIILGPDNELWTESPGLDYIERFDSRDGALLSAWSLQQAEHSNNVGMTVGPDGDVWLSLNGRSATSSSDTPTINNQLVQVTPAGQMTVYSPGRIIGPGSLRKGPPSDPNSLWFGEDSGGFQLGRFSTTDHSFSTFTLPNEAGTSDYAMGITLGPDASGTPNSDIWVGTYGGTTNYVERVPVTPSGPAAPDLVVTLPSATWHIPWDGLTGGVVDPTTGKQDGVWFADDTGSSLGHVDNGGNMTTWDLTGLSDPEKAPCSTPQLPQLCTNPAQLPRQVEVGPDSKIWFPIQSMNSIARFDPTTGAITLYRPPDGTVRPIRLANGPDGNVWFASVDVNKIGRIDLNPVTQPAAAASDFTLSGQFNYNYAFANGDKIPHQGFPFGIAAEGADLEVAMGESDRLQRVPTNLAGGPPDPADEELEGASLVDPTTAGKPWRTIRPQDNSEPRFVAGNAPSGVAVAGSEWATMNSEAAWNVIPGTPGVTGDNWVPYFPTSGALACCFTDPPISGLSGPFGVTINSDGAFIAETTEARVGWISAGGWDEESLPTADSAPLDLVSIGSGDIDWITEFRSGKIARRNGADSFSEFPAGGSQPYGITEGPDGAPWYTLQADGAIARMDPATQQVKTYALPTPNSQPTGIALGPDGALYVTEFLGGKLARLGFDATGHPTVWTEWNLPYADLSRPYWVTAGPDSKVWVTLPYRDQVASLDPATAPPAPAVTSPLAGSTVTQTGSTPISGTGVAGDTVAVLENGRSLGSTTVGPNGAWSVAVALPAGTNTVSAAQSDPAGLARTLSAAVTFNVVSTPAAPVLAGTAIGQGSALSWSTPGAGSAPITSYELYRGSSAGAEAPYQSLTATSFIDDSVTPGATYYYQVAAVNSVGIGPRSAEVAVTPASFPGYHVVAGSGSGTLYCPAGVALGLPGKAGNPAGGANGGAGGQPGCGSSGGNGGNAGTGATGAVGGAGGAGGSGGCKPATLSQMRAGAYPCSGTGSDGGAGGNGGNAATGANGGAGGPGGDGGDGADLPGGRGGNGGDATPGVPGTAGSPGTPG